MSLTVELVQHLPDFEALQPDWNELVESMAFPEIFHFWEWNFCYFKHYRTADELFILVVRDQSKKVVSIAPLCIRSMRRLGVRIRVLETIVVNIGDYRNFLTRAGTHRGRVVEAVLDYLRDSAARWDVIDIAQFSSRDSTTAHLATLAQGYPGWNVRVRITTATAVRRLSSPTTAEDVEKVRRLRRKLKDLERRGLQVQIGSADFAKYWPTFCELHRKTWPLSPFHEAVGMAFYDDLKSRPGLKEKLEFSVAEFQGRPVAMHFGFVDRSKLYHYMTVMDREFRNERVGAVLLYVMIQHYQKTLQNFDFMRGMETYKLWFTDDLDISFRLVIHRNASGPAFLYNLGAVTRQYAIDLGFPRAALQLAKGGAAKVRDRLLGSR
ncbi:Acetyltransferase involved in cellulose biosynthesis, CelD/BcsL family [Rhodospirillales bacterium URHD0017]|nr:Acetyltransferase involved in cellulose biosynthesis, CelD/BcsL family [Rhodospirillales bacterium URHD0017]